MKSVNTPRRPAASAARAPAFALFLTAAAMSAPVWAQQQPLPPYGGPAYGDPAAPPQTGYGQQPPAAQGGPKNVIPWLRGGDAAGVAPLPPLDAGAINQPAVQPQDGAPQTAGGLPPATSPSTNPATNPTAPPIAGAARPGPGDWPGTGGTNQYGAAPQPGYGAQAGAQPPYPVPNSGGPASQIGSQAAVPPGYPPAGGQTAAQPGDWTGAQQPGAWPPAPAGAAPTATAPATASIAPPGGFPPDNTAFPGGTAPGAAPASGFPAAPGEGVSVARLEDIDSAGAGVADPRSLNLPVDIWRGVSAEQAVDLVSRLRPSKNHAANRFSVLMLSASFEAPRRNSPDTDLFTARLEALRRFGAADVIARLGEIGGQLLHPIAIDAALIADRAPPLCDALLSDPEAEKNHALTRIFCLTLTDDAAGAGTGAGVAIQAARALGESDELTLTLLEAAADPGLASYIDPPKNVSELTPLRLAAMRSAGIEPPTDYARSAPLARLSPADAGASPRAQLEALERLEVSGAIGASALAAAYGAASSAESGGIWGRVEAYRGAISAPPPDTIRAFRLALGRAREGGREAMMARLLAPELARRAASGAPMQDATLRRALRLGGQGDAASLLLTPAEREAAGPEERALDRVAVTVWNGPWSRSDLNPLLARAARGDQRAGSLMAALNAFGVETPDPALYATPPEIELLAADGRYGELIFGALARLTSNATVGPETLYESLQMLLAAGQNDIARQIAVDAILIDG